VLSFKGVIMFNRIYSVAFCHFLEISVFCIIMKLVDMLNGSSMIDFFGKTTKRVWLLNGFRVLSVSFAVWDDQFVRMVKKENIK
jgi:hypothetical protein